MWRLALILTSVALADASAEAPAYKVEKVLGNLQYASAVAWSPDSLLVADLPAGRITRITSQGASLTPGEVRAAALAFDSEERLLICDSAGHRVLRTDKRGKQEVLASVYEGKRFTGPSGVAVAKNNTIWFTDSGFGSADRDRQLSFNGLYRISSRGEVTLVSSMNTRPNGIALSPDGKTLYVVDSDTRAVLAWDLDRSGNASNQRQLFRTREGVPNGILAGPDGRLYVATRNIEIYSASGSLEGLIEMPEKPADLSFGDTGGSNVYVAARTSVYRIRFEAKGGTAN